MNFITALISLVGVGEDGRGLKRIKSITSQNNPSQSLWIPSNLLGEEINQTRSAGSHSTGAHRTHELFPAA